jgi:hypothetical protein
MRFRARTLALLIGFALAAGACSGTPAASPSPTPTAAPSPTPTPTPTPEAFTASRALEHAKTLLANGPREAGSESYRKAATYVASELSRLGYSVTRQRVPLPAGESEGVAVPAGSTENVIATPPGYNPSAPHLLVGAHLDSVAPSPGANDNASGTAALLELARLARSEPTAMPIVWVAFGGEERRFRGTSGGTFGSRFYRDNLSAGERRGLRGVLSIDMIGNGPAVFVCHGGRTPRPFVNALLDDAKRLQIKAFEQVVSRFFSDHSPFESSGFTVAWLWSGEHSTVHTPRATLAVLTLDSLDRVGRVAWETLRSIRM